MSGQAVLRIGMLAPPWVPVPHPGSCDRLVIGGRHVSITVRHGTLIARADDLDVIDTRAQRHD